MTVSPARTINDRGSLVAYVASKLGTTPQALVGAMPFEVVAVQVGGKTLGAVIYINYRGSTIEMAAAGETGWLTRSNIRDLFAYPFKQLGCWTVLSIVARRNAKAREFNKQLGFTELGVVANGPSKDDDSIVHTMTKPQCKWIRTNGAVVDFTPAKRVAGGSNG
jgi:hypothetical protein